MAKQTYTSDYPILSVAVDVVGLTIADDRLQVLTIERHLAPHGTALPGGFVGIDENLEQAAYRELEEETAVDPGEVPLEQLKTYGDPGRDPRTRVISVAYLMVLPEPLPLAAGTDAEEAHWQPVDELDGPLVFDHARIVADGVERLKSKLEYTALATAFLPDEFTLGDLRRVYETVWQGELEPGNFQRKLRAGEDFVEALDRTVSPSGGRGRPATLFRSLKGPFESLDSPLTRRSLRSS